MLPVTSGDLMVTSIAFGFTVGFSWFVLYHAVKLTYRAPRWSAFVVMCWLEILVSLIFAVICMLHMRGVIPHSFWIYFSIVTCWAMQVQFLLQIIVNRVCILLHRPQSRIRLKLIVAIWITLINITVYCIWIPSKLQISDRYHNINLWWDRTEKCLYLLTDGLLNGIFISTVRKRLVNMGLTKYDKLVKFNQQIIIVSLAMDILIIAMMSYRNDFVYLQFHPLAYMVKLEIEMTMSKLIIKIAKSTSVQVYVCTSPYS
ncbi:hypothetical protein K439DRAFT_1364370 [Ramaria rubella]|nr:hypothetical protein K439DRAFT_1364370 [Ramaria rubella]